jgi:hypothetical protein
MGKRFLLFGEKPFEAYALEKFSQVKQAVENLSEVEILMYRDTFDELVTRTVTTYQFPHLAISFENKMVDLVNHPDKGGPRYYAEYTLSVAGDAYFLGLTPSDSGTRFFPLSVCLRKNVISFEIDSGSRREELSPQAMERVKSEYLQIRNFIVRTEQQLNETIDFFNKELERFVIPLLANRLRAADKIVKVKEALNFK